MKKIILLFVLSFLTFGTFANEENKSNNEKETIINADNISSLSAFDSFEDCVITRVVEIRVNGEMVYGEGTLMRIEGMSCDDFFFYLSQIGF
jgi:hypothetical protein